MSQQPTQQICPNCQGGNPLVAAKCMWCGATLSSGHTPPPQFQPQPVHVTVNAPKRSPVFPIVVLGLLGICGIIAMLASTGAGNRAKDTPTASQTRTAIKAGPTKIPVEGPTYAEYKGKKATMTDAQWAQYIKTLDSTHITAWDGWVNDVVRRNDSVYELKIDKDGPDETLAVADVIIDIPAADATLYNKAQKVEFSGTINRIDCNFGSCKVIVQNATITPR